MDIICTLSWFMGVIGLLTRSLLIQHPKKSTNIKWHISVDINEVSWTHTAINLNWQLRQWPFHLRFLKWFRNSYFVQAVISQRMFCVTILLWNDNEYEIFFFLSSHKLMVFFFLSLNVLICLLHTVKKWLPVAFVLVVTPYPHCISPAILTVYEILNPKEHKWSTSNSFCLPSFIYATGFLDSHWNHRNKRVEIYSVFVNGKKKNTISVNLYFSFIEFRKSCYLRNCDFKHSRNLTENL